MNRFAGNRAVRSLTLLAALAFAFAPVELLASCECLVCSCGAAGDGAPACCCGNEQGQTGCCGQSCRAAQSENCCGSPSAAPQSAGCLCPKVAPSAPVGASTNPKFQQIEPSPLIIAITPLASEFDALARLTAQSDQPLAASVPLRVLLRVWRI